MNSLWYFLSEYSLAIIALSLTLVFLYHYVVGRGISLRISKKYRSDIYETQSKIFLNATKYLISGNKDLAIKEFLSAVDISKDTLETYFALGGLFRSNGEINQAISIHHSIMARENITPVDRVRALRELAHDFWQAGMLDKAVATYKDALSIDSENADIIMSLCNIHEDLAEWDVALVYRNMLSKVSSENQSQVISHILVEKAKQAFQDLDIAKSLEILEDAFTFAPSISAKILRLKLHLVMGEMSKAESRLLEICYEHPEYLGIILEDNESISTEGSKYQLCLNFLRDYFISIDNPDLHSEAILLVKVKLLSSKNQYELAYQLLAGLVNKDSSQIMLMEYIKILIKLKKNDEVLQYTGNLLVVLEQSYFRFYCEYCGQVSRDVFWRCPQCKKWETIKFNWKI